MPPKKGKKGRKKGNKAKIKNVDQMPAVDRQFYELTITDLNNKLARLRAHNEAVELTNEQTQAAYKQLKEDRNDVTAHLDRTLKQRDAEVTDLKTTVKELIEIRQEQEKVRQEEKVLAEKNYHAMAEQMVSEVKLLSSKVATTDVVIEREAHILEKLNAAEKQLLNHEWRCKEKVYEVERAYIIKQDQFSTEIENKLMDIAEQFREASETRMATYMKSLIRENIALNNEMDRMLATMDRITAENEKMKEKYGTVNREQEIDFAVNRHLVWKCQKTFKNCQSMTNTVEKLKLENAELNYSKNKLELREQEIQELQTKMAAMQENIAIATQHLDFLNRDRVLARLETKHFKEEYERIKKIMKYFTLRLKSVQKGFNDPTDKTPFREAQRRRFVDDLLKMLEDIDLRPMPSVSVETIEYNNQEIYPIVADPKISFDTFITERKTHNLVERLCTCDDEEEQQKSSQSGESSEKVSTVIYDGISGSELVFELSQTSEKDDFDSEEASFQKLPSFSSLKSSKSVAVVEQPMEEITVSSMKDEESQIMDADDKEDENFAVEILKQKLEEEENGETLQEDEI
jgi:hypothetical protein